MKKYITGAGIGALLILGGTALASGNAMSIVNSMSFGSFGTVSKVYDQDSETICYIYKDFLLSYSHPIGGISCVKNN